jgi:type-F conjugative transfer system pilin assembly protein TrbC
MAQKKLLFPLILLLFCGNAIATPSKEQDETCCNARFEFKKEDLEYAKDIRKRSMQMNMPTIKKKWYELQEMLGRNINQARNSIDSGSNDDSDDLTSNTSLRIFASSSMSMNLLKSYAKSAKKYNAILVFQGLPDGSWRKLSDLVSEISGNDNNAIAMQIDDESFKQFGITNVPSFVLAKEEDVFSENPKVTFDKVTGSIGIKKALELFKDHGELAEIAQDKLIEAEGEDQ